MKSLIRLAVFIPVLFCFVASAERIPLPKKRGNLEKRAQAETATRSLEAAAAAPEEPPSNDEIAKKVGQIFVDFMNRVNKPNAKVKKAPVFGKDHGCLTALFTIDPEPGFKPEDFGVTVFKNASYPAWIRFANDGSPNDSDTVKKARGAAIKLVGVDNEGLLDGKEAKTIDFVMQNHRRFFSNTAFDFFKLNTIGADEETQAVFDEMDKNELADPLDGTYWTPLEQKFGPNKNMKYRLQPCPSNEKPDPKKPAKPTTDKDYLRKNLKDHLAEGKDICMEFHVQLLPKEPSTVEKAREFSSEEGEQRFRKLATITIPHKQNIDDPKRKLICENLFFTNWHAPEELRPLGSLNDIRRFIYPLTANLRRAYNKKNNPEITDAMINEPTKLIIDPLDKDKSHAPQGEERKWPKDKKENSDSKETH